SARLRSFIRMSYPLYLLIGAILYSLGAGLARYLGVPVRWDVFWIGLLWVIFFQASGHYLNAYFGETPAVGVEFRSPFRGAGDAFEPGNLPRQVALWSAYACLAVTASLTVLMERTVPLDSIAVLLILIAIGVIGYTIPPFRGFTFSYRELIVSVWMGGLIPALSFLMQEGELHRLIATISLPLVALHFALTLVFGLEDFALDIRYQAPSFLVRIGWQEGMNLHNYLIGGAYLLILAGLLFNFPWQIAWPILLTLPLAAYQVWNMVKIARGGKPLWRSLQVTAIALFVTVSYLAAFGFWIR
ncbi:MAG TPA: prenyltransferase, partial [Anaerolineales bacterium]|nr:prenyltransferase [Anaerolineales bacterium]